LASGLNTCVLSRGLIKKQLLMKSITAESVLKSTFMINDVIMIASLGQYLTIHGTNILVDRYKLFDSE